MVCYFFACFSQNELFTRMVTAFTDAANRKYASHCYSLPHFVSFLLKNCCRKSVMRCFDAALKFDPFISKKDTHRSFVLHVSVVL